MVDVKRRSIREYFRKIEDYENFCKRWIEATEFLKEKARGRKERNARRDT